MKLVIRKGNDKGWGFVEKYQTSGANKNLYVKVIVGISPEGKMVEPYAFRGKEFISLRQIEEEVGIDKYIVAKKPFYSLLSDGFIASITTCFNYETGEIIDKKSTYTVYESESWVVTSDTEGELSLRSIIKVPEAVDTIKEIQKTIAETRGNREEFFKERLKEVTAADEYVDI